MTLLSLHYPLISLLNALAVVSIGKNLYKKSRPEMTGINHQDDKKFGKIIDDWRCCDPSLMIYGEDEKNLRYKVSGGCCQAGLMCKGCEMCYEVKFYIYEANATENPKNAVGSIVKKKNKLLQGLFTDADNFDIYFPSNASAYEKLMIIGATLMLDYTYFEDNGNDKNRRHRRHLHY